MPSAQPPAGASSAAQVEVASISTGVLVFLTVLWSLFGHSLSSRSRYLSESGAACLLGLAAGLALLACSKVQFLSTRLVQDLLQFNSAAFFTFLLPPVIFYAGLSVQRRLFFQNLLSILSYGVVGTLVSFLLIAMVLFSIGGPLVGMSMEDCLALGAIFAATDSVAVLQLLDARETPQLFSLVFGEGIVNDATSVVLLGALARWAKGRVHSNATTFGGWGLMANFLYLLITSTLMGVAAGLGIAALLRSRVASRGPHHEVAVVGLLSYLAYLASEVLGLSGILALFCCGAAVSHGALRGVAASTASTHGGVRAFDRAASAPVPAGDDSPGPGPQGMNAQAMARSHTLPLRLFASSVVPRGGAAAARGGGGGGVGEAPRSPSNVGNQQQQHQQSGGTRTSSDRPRSMQQAQPHDPQHIRSGAAGNDTSGRAAPGRVDEHGIVNGGPEYVHADGGSGGNVRYGRLRSFGRSHSGASGGPDIDDADGDGPRLVRPGGVASSAWASASSAVHDFVLPPCGADGTTGAMSVVGASATLNAFHSLSYVAEGLIFIYVGMDALDPVRWQASYPAAVMALTGLLLLLLLVARAASVVPLSLLHNLYARNRLTGREILVIWWSGLMRGAVSVALVYLHFDTGVIMPAEPSGGGQPASAAPSPAAVPAPGEQPAPDGSPAPDAAGGTGGSGADEAEWTAAHHAAREHATMIAAALLTVLASALLVSTLSKPLLTAVMGADPRKAPLQVLREALFDPWVDATWQLQGALRRGYQRIAYRSSAGHAPELSASLHANRHGSDPEAALDRASDPGTGMVEQAPHGTHTGP